MAVCRRCGVELSTSNTFKHKKSCFICRICEVIQRKENRSRKVSIPRLIVHKGENYPPRHILRDPPLKSSKVFYTFTDKAEVLAFRRIRAIQKRFGKGHDSSGARVGCKASTLVLSKPTLDEFGKLHTYKHYDDSHCEECQGILRFDERGYKVCEDCGLLSSEPNIINYSDKNQKREHRPSMNLKAEVYGESTTHDSVVTAWYAGRRPDWYKPQEDEEDA